MADSVILIPALSLLNFLSRHHWKQLTSNSDMCFAAWQYKQYGYITNSMIITSLLHAIYVIDFFCNEGWYGSLSSPFD